MTSPTLPTDSIYKINLAGLFKNNPNLYSRVADLNSSTSSISSNNSAISNRSQRSNQGSVTTQSTVQKPIVSQESEGYRQKKNYQVGVDDEPIPASRRKKRIIVN